VHHLQGKAEGVTSTELQHLLRDFYLERLGLLMRHEQSAQVMGDYDINNAYQYVLAREETHISWLQHALLDLGAEIPADPSTLPALDFKRGPTATDVAREDVRLNQQFIDKWRDRVEVATHARHKGMLKVILGEMAEQRRFFEQAAAGNRELLGKALAKDTHEGRVLATRWVE
jgi:hypothetical protein